MKHLKWLAPLALAAALSSAQAQTWTKLNTGIARSVSPNQIGVDIGTSSATYIPLGTIVSGVFSLRGPTGSARGGVYQSSAATNFYVTGIDASGNFLTVSPQAVASTWSAQQTFTNLASPALPGLTTNVVGSGIPGLAAGQWFIYNGPSSVPSYLAGLRTQFDPSYTGGTPGVTRYAHWVRCNPTAGVADYIWCGLDQLTNSATGGQNTARYIQATKKSGAGPTFGFVSELRDDSGSANPASGLVNEIDIVVNGTDTSIQRLGLDFVAKTYGAGAVGHVGRGISFTSSGGAIFDTLVGGTANIGNGIDLSGMTVTGSPFKSAGFSVNNVGNTIVKTLAVSAAAPAASSCGTSPSVASNSSGSGGKVTFGSGSTACTLTFSVAYANAAFCTITPMAQPAAVSSIPYISAQSKTAFTISGGVDSGSYTYTCAGN